MTKLTTMEGGRVLATYDTRTSTTSANTSVEAVGFCSVFPWVASGSTDGQLLVFDMQSGQVRQTFKHTAGVTNAKWLPKSHVISSCSDDGTVRLWDTRSGECMRTLQGHTDTVFDFAFQSATGGSGIGGLVSASDDHTLRYYNL